MSGFSELESVGIKPRGFKWTSLTYIALLLALDSYFSTTKTVALYPLLLERLGSPYLATTFMSLQGFLGLAAPFIGLVSDKVRVKCRRATCPLLGTILIVASIFILGEAFKLSVLVLLISLASYYLGIILIEIPALAVIVDDFPPYQRFISVSIAVFAYFASATLSFIVNGLMSAGDSFSFDNLLITSLVILSVIVSATILRYSQKLSEVKGTADRTLREALSEIDRVKGAKHFYLGFFLAYVVFSALSAVLLPGIYEEFIGGVFREGQVIPISAKMLALMASILFNIGAMIGALSFSLLSRYVDYRKTPVLGEFLFVIFAALGLYAGNIGLGLASAAISGWGLGLLITFAILYSSVISRSSNPGVVYGLFTLSYTLAYAVGPYLAYSLAMLLISYRAAFLILTPLIFASAMDYLRVLK